ncbi:hypothetical protein [Sphingomonas sp.]|uniref:hypothetical protein n=1 Tax=Sphingomonas sp. TaxID=28214 RepID=UPI003B002D50
MRPHTALLLAALSVAPAAARERVPAAMPTGPAVTCLNITQLRESRVRDDRTIDFYTSGRRVYRVTLPQACPQLGFEQRFSYETSLSQLCSTDIITVLQSYGGSLGRGASCGMAPFQPVTLIR